MYGIIWTWQWFPLVEVISCLEYIGHLSLCLPPHPLGLNQLMEMLLLHEGKCPDERESILPIIMVIPNLESPCPSFRDHRHPARSLFPVHLLENGSMVEVFTLQKCVMLHCSMWQNWGNIGWFFYAFYLLKIIYTTFLSVITTYVHSRKTVK